MRLPIREIAGRSYGAVFGDPRAVLRCAAVPWLVVMAGAALAGLPDASWLVGPERTPLGSLAIELSLGTSFTVAWSRWILLGERRRWLAAPRFGRRELALLGCAAALLAAGMVPAALPFAVGSLAGPGLLVNAAVSALVLAAGLWIVVLSLRATLVYPLVALDAGWGAIARSWRATRGHALALAGLFVVTEVPVAIVESLVPGALEGSSGASAWVALAVEMALYFPATAITATAAALATRSLDLAAAPTAS